MWLLVAKTRWHSVLVICYPNLKGHDPKVANQSLPSMHAPPEGYSRTFVKAFHDAHCMYCTPIIDATDACKAELKILANMYICNVLSSPLKDWPYLFGHILCS